MPSTLLKERADQNVVATEGDALTVSYPDLTPERFSSTLNTHGVILIRNLFPASEVAEVTRELQDLTLLIDNLEHHGMLTQNGLEYLRQGHPADILPNACLLQNALNKPLFVQCLQKHFGEEELVAYSEPTSVRYCDPKGWKNYVPWHQDILDRGDAFVTIWAPLTRVGGDTPNLEFAPYKLRERIYSASDKNFTEEIITRSRTQTGDGDAYAEVGLTSKLVDEKAGPRRFSPSMEVGDVLVFDPYTVHRTCFKPGMTRARISLDIRLHPHNRNPLPGVWKSDMIRFPSKETLKKKDGPTLYNMKHLLAQNTQAVNNAVPSAENLGTKQLLSILSGRIMRQLKNELKKYLD